MHADIISETKLRALVPEEFERFELALREDRVIAERIAKASGENGELALGRITTFGVIVRDHLMWKNGDKDLDAGTRTAWRKLRTAFRKATGLTLFVGYYDAENGGRYDCVPEVYWHVGGMYELTEAGKKMKRFVKRESFVQWS